MAEVLESAVPDVAVDTTSANSEQLDNSSDSTVDSTGVNDQNLSAENTDEAQSQQTEEVPSDGRMPEAFKQYLKELQQTNPRLAKQLRGDFFMLQQIRQFYPGGIKDIQKVAQVAEAIGGTEGLQAFEAERAEWNALDEQFTAGDPKFIENISTQDPEAFKKLVPHALTQFSKLDPEGYDHLLSGVIIQTLEGSPLGAAYQVLAAGDEKAKQSAADLAKWYNDIDKIAKQKPVAKVDPEREKLTKERQEFENQKAQEFHNSVTTEMRAFNSRQIDSDLAAQLTKASMNPAAFKKSNGDSYAILMRNCNTAIQEILDRDTRFIEQYKTVLMSGDKQKALQMAQAKVKLVSPEAVKRTLRAFLAFGTPKPKPLVTANGSGNGQVREVQMSREPKPNEIDWARTTKGMVLDGKAYLKTRKEMVRF